MDRNGAATDDSKAQIETFLKLDRLGAVAGIAAVVVANLAVVQEPNVFLVLPFLAALVVMLTFSLRTLRNGNLPLALWIATIGNWTVALVVTLLFSFLWPVMVLTSLMPLVLAMPHLPTHRLTPFLAGGAVTGVLICSIGLLRDDNSLIEDVDEVIEFVAVVGGFALQASVVGLLVWQGNQMHRQALDNAMQLNRDLSESRVRLVEAGDRERSRIERDLHDGAQQRLAAMGVRLRLHASQNADADNELIDGLITELGEATTELRELAHGVYPPLLEQRGLVPAISAVARRIASPIKLELGDVGRFDRRTESALYFVCREAITNAQKHRPDAAIAVTLSLDEHGGPQLEVSDTGPGFDPGVSADGRGVLNMRDRLAAVDGTLDITSSPQSGTTVTAAVPGPVLVA